MLRSQPNPALQTPPRRPLTISTLLVAATFVVGCGSNDMNEVVPLADRTTNHGVFSEQNLRLARTSPTDPWLVRVGIGNPATTAIEGRIALTVVNLTDHTSTAVVTAPLRVAAGQTSTIEVPLPTLPVEIDGPNLVNWRLDYQLAWTGGQAEGTRSAWAALERIGLVGLEPPHLTPDTPGSLTLFVIDPSTRAPIAGADVTATGSILPATARTDAAGRAILALEATPDDTAEEARITVTASHGGVSSHHEIVTPIVRMTKLLLTSDKPLYQPGQTIHIRTLALTGHDRTPVSEESIVFEVVDPKGNFIDRQFITTDSFGVAATTFTLARQVLLGDWKIRAILDDVTSEKTIAVDRYTLPKFKVEAGIDKPWHRPGESVRVAGQARYFFGKAVGGGTVTARAAVQDVEFNTFAEVATTTDDAGVYAFDVKLPDHIVGLPLTEGRGLFRIDIEVTDTAGQAVTRTVAGTIAKGGLSVSIIPDGGRIVAGLDNLFHVVTTTPNGTGLAATVGLFDAGIEVATTTTDANGFGRFTLPVDLSQRHALNLVATAGNERFERYVTLSDLASRSPLAIRPDRSIYRDGDTATIDVFVATPTSRVWLDAVHAGQTVFSASIDIDDGLGRHQFDVDGTMAGDLILSAFFIDKAGTMQRDQRFVYVQPDNELKVTLAPRRESHGPGEFATVDVTVEDAAGRGVVASVGVQIVDEALFALTEVQPGLLKVFFSLMNEIMTPTLTAGCTGCDVASVIRDTDATNNDKADIAFSALGAVKPPGREFETWMAAESGIDELMRVFGKIERTRIMKALAGTATHPDMAPAAGLALVRGLLRRDPWGGRWKAETTSGAWPIRVTSAGPDERSDTHDDIVFGIHAWDIESQREATSAGNAEDAMAGGPPPWAIEDDMFTEAEDPDLDSSGGGNGAGGEVRVRRNFPETLYVDPRVITDGNGRAAFEVGLADSITSWRMTGLASSRDGLVGSGVGSMLVFQDFFADIDAPVALTRNDKVRVPVALYNYLDRAQTVTITLEPAVWFDAVGETVKVITLDAGEVAGTHFDIMATAVGTRPLRITARGTTMNDAVERLVRVMPDGRAYPFTSSSRFASGENGAVARETVTETIVVPDAAIEGATELEVQVFPGVLAQATEGMDSLLRMPNGCFEQTTSSAWPNVLVTDYLQRSGKSSPAVEMRAKTYITEGYQRLLTFECASGGFNWWEGDNPGNTVLTAVAVMMFTDTKRVAFVDDAVIERAAAYLAQTQKADGSWGEERHLHSGNENLGAGSVRSTAYTTWALLHAGRQQAATTKAIGWLRGQTGGAEARDLYTAALMVLALASNDATDPALTPLLSRIVEGAISDDLGVHWKPTAGTMVGGHGDSGNIETTAVATLALLATQTHSALAQGAIKWLIGMKDPNGNWGYSTQATVLTLKALLGAIGGDGAPTEATIHVRVDGDIVATRTFTDANADIRWSTDLAEHAGPGTHVITIDYEGRGNLTWQIAGAAWLPFANTPDEAPSPLAIEVAYDRTTLATDDVITVNVRVTNDGSRTGMMMAELGIPPGFELDTTPLDAILGQGVVSDHERSALKLVVYLEPVTAGTPATFSYKLRALWPLEATAPESSTWLYYDHATRATAGPVAVRVD